MPFQEDSSLVWNCAIDSLFWRTHRREQYSGYGGDFNMTKDPDAIISEALQEISTVSNISQSFLKKEERIKLSRIREVFTPYHPVDSIDLFCGRQNEIKRIAQYINTPGQHALIFGERGLGKSSLANIAVQLLFSGFFIGNLYRKRCSSEDGFERIIEEPFKAKKFNINESKKVESYKSDKKASVKVPILRGEIKIQKNTSTELKSPPITPSYAADVLVNLPGVLVIDEADVLHKNVKKKLAEFVKILSDNRATFKVLIVGIASTAGELLLYHKSVQRCLKETKITPMCKKDLEQIITKGSEKLRDINSIKKIRISFLPEISRKIVSLSDGLPYYTHLLALKCAEEAISKQNEIIDDKILSKALENAALDFEQTLENSYEESIGYPENNDFISLLIAASLIENDKFWDKEIHEKLKETRLLEIDLDRTKGLMKELSIGYTSIFHEIREGLYKFSEPRMSTFIKMKNWKWV